MGSVAVNALHPQMRASTEYHSANLVPAWGKANPSVWRTPRARPGTERTVGLAHARIRLVYNMEHWPRDARINEVL